MSSAVLDLLSGYISPQLLASVIGGPAGVGTTRADFRDLLASRTMTMAYFPDDESLYRELEDAYRFFFDEEPPTAMRG